MSEVVKCIKDIELVAHTRLNQFQLQIIEGGSQDEQTKSENIKALRRIKFRPRIMRDVSNRDMRTSFLGFNFDSPIALSAHGLQGCVHPEAEKATAGAAKAMNTFMILSHLSSFTAEDVLKAQPGVILFQHIQISDPREVVEQLIQKSTKAGVSGFVLNVDQVVKGNMLSCSSETIAKLIEKNTNPDARATIQKYGPNVYCAANNSWEDLSWVKSLTSLPVIVKGITHPEDAILALKYGADAIHVSNHGGRCLDSMEGTIDALPDVVKAVNGKCEVLVDNGFRSGLDVFKGLALGAKIVLLVRPICYGLAYDGENGVKKVLEIVRDELDNTMALAGCKTLADINSSLVVKKCGCE